MDSEDASGSSDAALLDDDEVVGEGRLEERGRLSEDMGRSWVV